MRGTIGQESYRRPNFRQNHAVGSRDFTSRWSSVVVLTVEWRTGGATFALTMITDEQKCSRRSSPLFRLNFALPGRSSAMRIPKDSGSGQSAHEVRDEQKSCRSSQCSGQTVLCRLVSHHKTSARGKPGRTRGSRSHPNSLHSRPAGCVWPGPGEQGFHRSIVWSLQRVMVPKRCRMRRPRVGGETLAWCAHGP